VELPPNVRDALRNARNALAPLLSGARWTPDASIHLTLKFLGDTPPSKVADITAVMDAAAGERTGFHLGLDGAGVFPNSHAARVLWAGVYDPAGACAPLARALEFALAPLGFPPEKRAYRPHLTLARFKHPARVQENILSYKPDPATFEVRQITLFQSRLRPEGAVYTPLHHARFF
jgi:2'-5' RNA ligase